MGLIRNGLLLAGCCLLALTFSQSRAHCQAFRADGRSLDAIQVARISLCVEDTFNEAKVLSRSQCSTPKLRYHVDNTEHIRAKLRYRVPFANYEFVKDTQSVPQNDGRCEHNLYANWQNTSVFECEWETSGCGPFKAGGFIEGYCLISIQYIPQPGDVAKIKEYCLSKELGGGAKPPFGPVACPELKYDY